ncbi:MAG TPA: hypothetical protein VD907_03855 [Verrucomicrobiae bacterium]|nr:hypothetical protein [Verrucomicrobiae bacterium]
MAVVKNFLRERSKFNDTQYIYKFSQMLDIGTASFENRLDKPRARSQHDSITVEIARGLHAIEGIVDFHFDQYELTIKVKPFLSVQKLDEIDSKIKKLFASLDIKPLVFGK